MALDLPSYLLGKSKGGGGGGTSNYNELSNKPKINNVELSGNKTSEDLGLAAKTYVDNLIPKLDFSNATEIYEFCENSISYDNYNVRINVTKYNNDNNIYPATIQMSELDFEIAEEHGFDVDTASAYQMIITIYNNETITKNIAYVGMNFDVEYAIEYISSNKYVDTSSFSYDSQTQTLTITIS